MAEKEKKEKSSKKKKQEGIAVAIWVLAFLVIVLLFVINWNKISNNLKNVGNKNENRTETVVPSDRPSTGNSYEIDLNDIITDNSEPAYEPEPEVQPVKPEQKNPAPEKKDEKPQAESSKQETKPAEPVTVKPESIKPETRTIKLYFVNQDPNGSYSITPVSKQINKTNSPLTDTLRALIAEPQINSNYWNLIPEGSKLIGASVNNGVATLNFNEEFTYNHVGVEGIIQQLKQIVYTATEFTTVKSVQILIEGKKQDFLQEGVYIGAPLTRNSSLF